MSLLLNALNKNRGEDPSAVSGSDLASAVRRDDWSIDPTLANPSLASGDLPEQTGVHPGLDSQEPTPRSPLSEDAGVTDARVTGVTTKQASPDRSPTEMPITEQARGYETISNASARQVRRWWQHRLGKTASEASVRFAVLVGLLATGVGAGLWWGWTQGGWSEHLPDMSLAQRQHAGAVLQTSQESSTPVAGSAPAPEVGASAENGEAPSPATNQVEVSAKSPASAEQLGAGIATNARRSAPPSARPQRPSGTAPAADDAPSHGKVPVEAKSVLRIERDPVDVLREQAESAMLAGRWAEAQHLYEAWLERRPDDPTALAGLAMMLHRQQRWTEAWSAYQRALQRMPDNAALRSAALSVLIRLDPMQAESRLRDWIADNPGDALAHAALGTLLARQQRWAQALEPLRRATHLAPGEAVYHYNLALVLERLNRLDQAAEHYRQSLAGADPSIPRARIEQHLDALRQRLARDATADMSRE